MEPELAAVWLSILLYVTHVLLPILPAAIIYKMFPSDRIGINGILHGMKLNATGAFAAYVIVFLLGAFAVSRALTQISGLTKQSWEVRAKVRFVDKHLRDLDKVDPVELNRSLWIDVRPDKKSITKRKLCFLVPKFEEGMTVTISVDGFVSVVRQIVPMEDDGIKVDHVDNVINLTDELCFERLEQHYRLRHPLQPSTVGPPPDEGAYYQ